MPKIPRGFVRSFNPETGKEKICHRTAFEKIHVHNGFILQDEEAPVPVVDDAEEDVPDPVVEEEEVGEESEDFGL